MKDKIDAWADSALSTQLPPDEAILTTIEDKLDQVNPEVIKRIVEAYNVKSFLGKQQKGEDMEQSFPLANAEVIIAKALKQGLKKVARYTMIEETYYESPKDTSEFVFPTERARYNPSGYVWSSTVVQDRPMQKIASKKNDTIRYALVKCAEYVRKFNDCYKGNTRFVNELRYLYPESLILKRAGLDKGKKEVPWVETEFHKEFHQIDQILEKVGAKKNKGPAPLGQPGETILQQYYKETPFSLGVTKDILNAHAQGIAGAVADIQLRNLDQNHPEILQRNINKAQSDIDTATYTSKMDLEKAQKNNLQIKTDLTKLIDQSGREGELEGQKKLIDLRDKNQKSIENLTTLQSKLDNLDTKKIEDLAKEKGKLEGLTAPVTTALANIIAQKSLAKSEEKLKAQQVLIEEGKKLGLQLGDIEAQQEMDAEQKKIDLYNEDYSTRSLPGRWGHLKNMAVNKVFSPIQGFVNPLFDPLNKNILNPLQTGAVSVWTELLKSRNPFDQISKVLAPPDYQTTYNDNTNKLLEVLRQKFIFESVMANDPNLKGADPKIMLNVYKTALNLAPKSMVSSPEIVKSVLRTANSLGSGGMDPETANILTKLESAFLRNTDPAKYKGVY